MKLLRRAPVGGPCRWRASWTMRSWRCELMKLNLGLWILKTAGNPHAVLAIDEFILKNQRKLVCARSAGHDAANVRAAGRFVTIAFRTGGTGLVFCGSPAGIGAGGGPCVYARHPGRRGEGSYDAVRDEFRRIADGERIVAIGCALLSGFCAARKAYAGRSDANYLRKKRSQRAWSPPRQTIWIGRMKCARRLNREPRFRRTL